MYKGFLELIWLTLLLLPPSSWQGVQGGNGAEPSISAELEQADSLFSSKSYRPALFIYRRALEQSSAERKPETLFKIAYAAYQAAEYRFSADLFFRLSDDKNFLPEYSGYFYLKSFWQLNPAKAVVASEAYLRQYRKHAFADSLILPIADYYFENAQYALARKYYLKAKGRGVDKLRNADFLIAAAHSLELAGNKKSALKAYRQILKKYASQQATLQLAWRLEKEVPDFARMQLFDFISVYMRNKRYLKARHLLEEFIKRNPDTPDLDKARFLLTKIYFLRGSYSTALYGFKNLLVNLKSQRLEPHIRIYIARSYRKLGFKHKAIEQYLEYANRFPRRRLAAEAVWKSAWLAEELNRPQKALQYYHQVYTRWPRCDFAREAYFREGFTYFRLNQYRKADVVFSDIRFKKWPDMETNRAQYWSALCRQTMGDSLTARRLHVELAKNLWDDYYTMRSYLLHKTFLDSTAGFADKLNSSKNPLLYYANGISTILPKIKAALQLRALLGKPYGKIALSDMRLSLKSKEEWIALAEIYKKFTDYGKAYEVYDFINRRYFSQVSFVEKTFMLKERFPLYFDNAVMKYGKRYGVEPEFVWAIMKQESKYKVNAHSAANAYGLMQLMPATARELADRTGRKLRNPQQLFKPDYNIRLGTLYLSRLSKQFFGKKERILAAYNAGPHRVNRWKKRPGAEGLDVFIENIEFSETRSYVRHVLKNYWAYQLLNDRYAEDDDLIFGFVDPAKSSSTE